MTADGAARATALDAARSFIVEAPAGSGKTGLLTQRFLRLLSLVERPESIVAMTFTRKAAGDMKERIHKALEEAAGDAPPASDDDHVRKTRELARDVLARDKQRGWNLLEDAGQLQIQTIDSLCATLTRQMPVISEFGGAGRVVEDARELRRMAARDTIRALTEGSAEQQALFRRVALHFDNDMLRLEIQVANMLQKREQWGKLPAESNLLVRDFAELLALALGSLRSVFRQTATVDFTEVARAARQALGTPENPTDLLYSLDYRIEHLLVDEFQDTSRSQYALIQALTEQWSDGDGRSLFLVGDPMQSIYRFREAEVALFLLCQQERRLGSVRLEPLYLTTNFRSTPEIVSWVKENIGPIMTEDNPRLGAVKFRVSEATREPSSVMPRIMPFIGDAGTAEAAEMVRVIQQNVGASMAILVRSRVHVSKILPALRKAGIPYRAIEIDVLKEQQHVLDLLSLTRAVMHLGDRVAWLACLRAPWCGLELKDLAALAENEEERTVLQLLSDAGKIAALSPDGRTRAVRAQENLAAAVENVGRVPLRRLIESLWLGLGGPAVLREASQHEDVQTFLDLIEGMEEGGTIRDFSLLNERLEIFFARPTTAEAAVEVMTIHQAKGLEFDIVMIPQAARPTRKSDADLLVWTEEGGEDGETWFTIAAKPKSGEKDADYERVCEEIKKKEEEENKRLFYVACTRAKNELYLSGSTTKKRDGVAKADRNTFMGMIWPVVQKDFESEARRVVPVQQSLLDVKAAKQTILNRLPATWRMPKFDRSVRWTPEFERARAAEREITYEWVGDASRHAGTVIHEVLKRMAAEGAGSWNDARVVSAELLRLGVPAGEEPAVTKQVLRAITNTMNSKRGQWILDAHSEARSEYSIAGRIQDKLISGAIDRMFRDEAGRLWVIDFKNSDHKGGKMEAFLDEEKRRYTAQLENYATLLSRSMAGPIWLGLYFPLLDAWREWRFADEAAAAGGISS